MPTRGVFSPEKIVGSQGTTECRPDCDIEYSDFKKSWKHTAELSGPSCGRGLCCSRVAGDSVESYSRFFDHRFHRLAQIKKANTDAPVICDNLCHLCPNFSAIRCQRLKHAAQFVVEIRGVNQCSVDFGFEKFSIAFTKSRCGLPCGCFGNL